MVVAGRLVDSLILLLALPVGASKAISSHRSLCDNLYNRWYNSHIALIIVVLPVPGPPVIIKKFLINEFFIACSWSILYSHSDTVSTSLYIESSFLIV